MAAQSPRMLWPYPGENESPWWEAFQDFIRGADASAFAARDDRNLILMGGGTIAFDSGTGILTWSAAIEIFAPATGFLNQVPAGSVTLADGQIFRALITRAPGANVSVSSQGAAGFAANSDNSLVFCIRRGTNIYWRNGLLVAAGTPATGLGITPGSGSLVLAGDVTGTLAATVVEALNGTPIAALTPSAGEVLTWDGAAWDAAAPTGGAFVFRPGGVAAGSVFITWATLHAAVTAADGDKIVFIDDSIDPAEVSAGAWNVNGWTFKGLISSSPPTLTVPEGATFTTPVGSVWTVDHVALVSARTTTQVASYLGFIGTVIVKNGGSIDGSATRPFFRVSGGSNPSFHILLENGGILGPINGNVCETATAAGARCIVSFYDGAGAVGATSFTQSGTGEGSLTYRFYGNSPAVTVAQSGYTDPISVEWLNDMRYMAEVIKDLVIDAQQTSAVELHVGSVYLKAGTTVKGTSAAMLGGSLVGETANLVMKRFTGAVVTGGVYTTIGTFAEANPLGGEFVITDSDFYDFYIYAGGALEVAMIKGLRLVLAPSIENGL